MPTDDLTITITVDTRHFRWTHQRVVDALRRATCRPIAITNPRDVRILRRLHDHPDVLEALAGPPTHP